jgi:hypothetical protein
MPTFDWATQLGPGIATVYAGIQANALPLLTVAGVFLALALTWRLVRWVVTGTGG